MVTTLAKAARVVRPVMVDALGRFPLIALVVVTIVAHEFGSMFEVIMTADSHVIQILQNREIESS